MKKTVFIYLMLLASLLLSAESSAKIKIGAMIYSIDHLDRSFSELKDAGFESCQINYIEGKMTDNVAEEIRKASGKYGIDVTTIVAVPGYSVWNFEQGPSTIGLVPKEGREAKLALYRDMIDFCVKAGVPAMHSHFGFIPEDMSSPQYKDFIKVMKGLAGYAEERGILIYFETGQETPVTLIRAIKDIGTGNVFINCDLANLVMYGKANPLDAVRQFGPLIREFHAKDGLYPDPADPYNLGREVSIPEGEVDFPAVIRELKKNGFHGSLTIERELAGDVMDYITKTRRYLQALLDDGSDERYFEAPVAMEKVYSDDRIAVWNLQDGVKLLETRDQATMYLIEGTERALLVDTGTEYDGLDDLIGKLTDKPYDVVLTHNHIDHAGSIKDFDSVWMHPADTAVRQPDWTGTFRWLEDGQTFDLGEREIEVRHMPGHTPGSVVLLDRKGRACYTGDAFGSGAVWLQLRPHVPVIDYYDSCTRMEGIMETEGITKLYCGHYSHQNKALDIKYIRDMKALARKLVTGEKMKSSRYPCSSSLSPKNTRSVTDGNVIIVYDGDRR